MDGIDGAYIGDNHTSGIGIVTIDEEASLVGCALYCCNYVSSPVDIEAYAEKLAVQMVCEQNISNITFVNDSMVLV